MRMKNASPAPVQGAAITLVATLLSIYIVSQFLRNSIGVIAPNLAEELGLSPAEIGLLSSAYFLAFAAVQIPVGMALDRFGPRICLMVGAAVTVIGAIVFATAANPACSDRRPRLARGSERQARWCRRSRSMPGDFRRIALPRSPACRSESAPSAH